MLSVKTNITAMILVVACALGQALQVWADRPPREFGVMANSDDMRRTPVARLAGMMKAIGYTSVAVSCKPEQFEMNMKAYRDAGIRVGAVYVGWTTDGNTVSYNIPIESVLDQLRGTGAVVMIHAHMTKDAKVSDQRIAGQLVTLAKQAEAAGVSIALYPHVGNRVATLEQAARIADMVDHPSLGVCFNLCHYLRQNRAEDLPAKLRAAKGRIKLVTISGADKGNTRVMNWKQLIRPIDQGQFDLPGLLELLCVDLEYQGPIFIQCYNLKAPARSILQDAFDRWQVLKKHCHPQDPSKLEAGKK